jgi:hypothetical protein
MTKYVPENCPKCGAALPVQSSRGGRPTRWCCSGCQKSGEAEMARINGSLKTFEDGLGVERLNGWSTAKREQVIADMQARYDHLAGVPPRAASES